MIDKLKYRFSIPWLCNLYGVSKSGYYRWKKHPELSQRYELLHKKIDEYVKRIHTHHKSYGYRSVCAVIHNEGQLKLSCNSVLKSMQRLDIHSMARKKRSKYAGATHSNFPNILDRQFNPSRPMQRVAVDVCQFYNHSQKYYFIAYLDMFNNEIISWNLARREDMSLILPPLRQLLAKKKACEELLLHSDQGSQFASYSYIKLLQDNGVTQSMSSAGTPRDNAVLESCFGWFKNMLRIDFNIQICQDVFATVAEAVDHFNHFRPAFALDYKTPVQFKTAQGF